MRPPVISLLLTFVATLCRSSALLRLENLTLQHQLAVDKQRVHHPRLRPSDRVFWAWLSRPWPRWQATLAFVQPRTVIAWQRKRFRTLAAAERAHILAVLEETGWVLGGPHGAAVRLGLKHSTL